MGQSCSPYKEDFQLSCPQHPCCLQSGFQQQNWGVRLQRGRDGVRWALLPHGQAGQVSFCFWILNLSLSSACAPGIKLSHSLTGRKHPGRNSFWCRRVASRLVHPLSLVLERCPLESQLESTKRCSLFAFIVLAL